MKTIKQVKREAKQLFRWCFVAGALDQDRVRMVMEHVLQSKRHGYLALAGQFERLVKLEQQQHTAEVESATELPTELRTSVQTDLARTYGNDISTTFREDPTLIGGMRIRVGSDVYDGSVKAGLRALRKSF